MIQSGGALLGKLKTAAFTRMPWRQIAWAIAIAVAAAWLAGFAAGLVVRLAVR